MQLCTRMWRLWRRRRTTKRLERIEYAVGLLLLRTAPGGLIMAAIDDLGTAVTGLETSSTTILALVESLATQGNQDAAIAAATGRIAAVTASLDASVAAHTPAPPAPPAP